MGDLASYLILLIMVVAVQLLKDRIFPVGSKSGTAVGAETHSPAVPIIIYANPIDKFIAENYPNARR